MQIAPALVMGEFSSWLLCPFDMLPCFFSSSSFFFSTSSSGITKHIKCTLYFSWADPEINDCCKESWFLLLEDNFESPRSGPWVYSLLLWCHCWGNKWRLPKWEQAKAMYSQFAIAMESAPSLAFDRDSKAGRGEGKLFSGRKNMPWLEAGDTGKLRKTPTNRASCVIG